MAIDHSSAPAIDLVKLPNPWRWSEQSLANSFALRAAFIAIISVLMVSAVSIAVIFRSEQTAQRSQLKDKAERLRDRVERTITVTESSIAELAKSPIFNTALLDSRGRDVYVKPFLENYSIPVAVPNGLALCDINGERLAGSRSLLSDCRAASPLFKRVLTDGKPTFELIQIGNGHFGWISYQPVIYVYTGTVEGVVVTQLDLEEALRAIPADLNVDSVSLMREKGEGVLVNVRNGEGTHDAMTSASVALFNSSTKSLPFVVEATVSSRLSTFQDMLPSLVLGYCLGAGLLLLGIVYWARRVANRLVHPLVGLTHAARRISESGDLRIAVPTGGIDEVGQLETAFQSMVMSLRESERTLSESESRLRSIYDVLPAGIILANPRGEIIDCNTAASRILRLSRDELLRRTLDGAEWHFRRADGSAMPIDEYASIRAMREKRVVRDVEMGLINANGTTWLSVSAMPVGDPKYGVAVSYTDISERKQAETDRRIAAIAFESQEGMVITDAGSKILRINRAFTDMTGYTSEEAVGRHIDLLKSGRHDKTFYAFMWDSIEGTGTWRGEVWNRRKNGEVFPVWLTITAVRGGIEGETHFVCTMIDITLRKAAEEEIRRLAFYDSLTGLPNRQLLLERLQRALASSERSRQHGALLYLDLDDFKTLNDTLGHDIGDQLLQQVAQRLSTGVREIDTVSRIGGDEFVVILEELSKDAAEAVTQTESVGEKIRASLEQPYRLGERSFQGTASVGATLLYGHRETVDELLKRADLAMYQAKTEGRNAVRFFDPEMQSAVNARAALEADLRAGLREGQLRLHYQAHVNHEGRVTGAEALVRWQHPVRGLVLPAEFIALAEETGLILPLGHWVLQTACNQLAKWRERPETAGLTVSVNVSPRQFRQPDFAVQTLEVLQRFAINPAKLTLELTESLLLQDVEGTITTMMTLKAHGVGFSLDDFGTGYSSLMYLKRLPLDQLKIDKSFVRDVLSDPNDAAIAKTIVTLAGSLGLSVIAEGVETREQRDFLAEHGCHAYQGYFFGKPGTVESLLKQAEDGVRQAR